jgi:hypothetical protein
MGLQRAFALPITLACLWALVARRYIWVGMSWVGAALFYPIVIPVLGLASGAVFLGDVLEERRLPSRWGWNALLAALAIVIVVLGSNTPESVGPMVTHEQALAMEEFGAGGRQNLYGTKPTSYYFGNPRTGLGWSPTMLLVVAAAVGITFALGRRRLVPRAAWILAGVGVTLWFLARLVMFHLYLPNRHSRYALAAFAIVAFTAAGLALIQALATSWPRVSSQLAVALIAPVIVLATLWSQAATAWQQPVDRDMERAYAYIATLPKDALVAAHPDLADYVPLRARHSVLASSEESIAFMLGYYRRLTPRIEASLRAAYATSWDELESTLAPYDVDVILTGPLVWQKSDYYAPFDTLTKALIDRGKREGFVLRAPPPDRILFKSGEVLVLSVGR